MSKNNLVLKGFSGKTIAFHSIYAKITGSITAGVLLSQLIYWWYACGEREYYKTNKELCDETGMSIDELKNAKKRVFKFFNVRVKGTPATTYYTMNEDAVLEAIQLDSVKATNQLVEKPPTSKWDSHQLDSGKATNYIHITENTTDNTTDNTTERYTSIDSITQFDLHNISIKYQVPESFVRSKLDDMVNYCAAKGRRYRNYKAALSNWVKKDALQVAAKANKYKAGDIYV